jgi:predicted nucleic acid-binding Zn ribbon protein
MTIIKIMNWQKVADSIPRDAKNISQDASVDGATVCKLWQEYAAKALLGRAIQAHEAINFRDGVITISVTDSTYLDDIRSQQRRVTRLVNQALGSSLVKTVRYLA